MPSVTRNPADESSQVRSLLVASSNHDLESDAAEALQYSDTYSADTVHYHIGEEDAPLRHNNGLQRFITKSNVIGIAMLAATIFYFVGATNPPWRTATNSGVVTEVVQQDAMPTIPPPPKASTHPEDDTTPMPSDLATEAAKFQAMVQAGTDMEPEDTCSAQGNDCRKTKCCQEPGMQCYLKDPFWAQCRSECNPGPDPTDQVSPAPWNCTALGPRSPGSPKTCAAGGEDCRASKCCKTAGERCFAKDANYAHCAVECTAGPNLFDEKPDPWTCEPLGEVTQGAAPWVEERCAAEGVDCRAASCCQESGYQCYEKDEFWAQCRSTCEKGELMPTWDQKPWQCGLIGSRTPDAAVEASKSLGKIGKWVPKTCAKAGSENCLKSQCCLGVDMQCYGKDENWANCLPVGTCSTAPDPDNHNKTASCTAIGPKGVGLALKGWPSLYCFSLLQTTSYEPGLLKEQVALGAGIFGCDGYTLLSNGVISLGKVLNGTEEVFTVKIETPPVGVSQDGTASNTLLFMKAWDEIIRQQRFRDYDWTLKVDPDAVLIADRMRDHMRPHNGENVYVVNCNKVPGSPNFPMMFGAVEVFSNKAMDAYAAGSGKCGKDFWPAWEAWGEDYYMTHCLDHLGVGRIADFGVLGDNMCTGANCQDGYVAAFHPFKQWPQWSECWNTATGR
jgi:hypothetical protein